MTRTTMITDGVFRYPADTPLPETNHQEESREPFYQGVIRVLMLAMRARGITVTVHGAGKIPQSGGALLAFNHTSYLDFVFGGVPAFLRGRRLVRFMSKKEVFSTPVAGQLMRMMKHISVDRAKGAGAIDEAVARLKAGELVGIFPEATISRSFELRDEFKTGAARIAHAAGVPLIPVAMCGPQRMWTKDSRRDKTRGIAVVMRVGDPIATTTDPESDTAALQGAMSELLDRVRDDYEQLPGVACADMWWWPASRGGSAPTREEAAVLDAEEKAHRAAKKAAKKDAPRTNIFARVACAIGRGAHGFKSRVRK